jgi:small conductance mechanosensitive channel
MPPDLGNEQLIHLTDVAWQWAETFLPRLVAALIILVVGYLVAGWIERATRSLLARVQHIDPTLKPILAALARYAVLVVLIIAALSQLGIQIASLLAVLGAAGLAVGLALQGTLSNIAAGIMLLWLRPFHVGDYIEVGGQGGMVEELGLFGCRLRTFDGLFLFLPNSSVWNAALKNHTYNDARMVSIGISLAGVADPDLARRALLDMAQTLPHVLRAPAPRVFVENFAGGTLALSLTIWTAPKCAGEVERTIIEQAKQVLDAMGDNFKPTAITRTVPPDTDPSRFLDGLEVGARNGAVTTSHNAANASRDQVAAGRYGGQQP